jgi:Flp pilus assembly protein TadG
MSHKSRLARNPRRFIPEKSGVTTVEFGLLLAPFVFLLLCLAQVFVFYMTQTSLDAGVNNAADHLRNEFAKATPTYPNAATLKTMVASTSGGMVKNDGALAVDLRPLALLGSAVVTITDQATPQYGAAGDTLVVRAQATALVFAPGFSSAKVRSSAIVRRKSL